MNQAMKDVNISRKTTCRVLLENLASYPAPTTKVPTTYELSRLLQDNSGSPTQVLKMLKSLVTYGKRWDVRLCELVEDREKREAFTHMVADNGDVVAEALKVGLQLELTFPGKISVALVTSTWNEFKQACLVLIALSAVKHVQLVPSLYTEGNTVIIGEHADFEPRRRDMNIRMKSHAELSIDMLENMLNHICDKNSFEIKG